MLGIANTQLQQSTWLAGEDFTLADVQFGHLLFRYFDIEIARKPPDRVAAYYEALQQRPCFREHVMVSYDELRSPK